MAFEPVATRPHMPGYGILGPDEGRGLLPWSWARERLIGSRNYWVSTVCPDGRPHAMPVWGVWEDDAFWFSSSAASRKARNLAAEPRCAVTTEDPEEPVVVQGVAAAVTDAEALAAFLALTNGKYETDFSIDLVDPAANTTFRVTPRWAFALTEEDFTGSPTRWTFPPADGPGAAAGGDGGASHS
jgi:PPOX class probable F420-dependent enzyme